MGLVTDASGESRKARRLFARKYPFLIVLDCYSHQVSAHSLSNIFRNSSSYLLTGEPRGWRLFQVKIFVT